MCMNTMGLDVSNSSALATLSICSLLVRCLGVVNPIYSSLEETELISQILCSAMVNGGGRSGTRILSAAAHITPRNSPFILSNILAALNSLSRGDNSSFIWFSTTTDGTFKKIGRAHV